MMAAARQLIVEKPSSCYYYSRGHNNYNEQLPFCSVGYWHKLKKVPGIRARVAVQPPSASAGNASVVPVDDDEDGVCLGTMKLPANTDVTLFETLLFQWANSLCQGATLPLPAPLKVDKVQGGARLGFIEIDDGKTEVLVYIDCLVSPATESSGPVFRAIRNGALRDQAPPGEPRIMRSLLQALQKSVQIAAV